MFFRKALDTTECPSPPRGYKWVLVDYRQAKVEVNEMNYYKQLLDEVFVMYGIRSR